MPDDPDDLYPDLPDGYRYLAEGEVVKAGDIYWSTKWYRVTEEVAPNWGAWSAARYNPVARKEGGTP